MERVTTIGATQTTETATGLILGHSEVGTIMLNQLNLVPVNGIIKATRLERIERWRNGERRPYFC